MIQIKKNVLLSKYSNYKIGGTARLFVEVSKVEELAEIRKQVQDNKVFVLGGGTNVLMSDEGFDGLVIHNEIKGILPVRLGQVDSLKVGAGVAIEEILNFCIENSLSGLEWAGGLPGTVGGAVRGNAGAFAGEIKDSVLEVESIDLKTLKTKKRLRKDCKFNYRESIWKMEGEREIITFVSLKFEKGERADISSKINEKNEYRKNRHPLEFPNIGSIFKNIPFESLPSKLKEEFGQYVKDDPFPVVPTAKIIALSGIKGKKVGGAMVSDKHTNFIVNVNNATSDDIRRLIAIVKQVVKDKFGIDLEEEIIYLGN